MRKQSIQAAGEWISFWPGTHRVDGKPKTRPESKSKPFATAVTKVTGPERQDARERTACHNDRIANARRCAIQRYHMLAISACPTPIPRLLQEKLCFSGRKPSAIFGSGRVESSATPYQWAACCCGW